MKTHFDHIKNYSENAHSFRSSDVQPCRHLEVFPETFHFIFLLTVLYHISLNCGDSKDFIATKVANVVTKTVLDGQWWYELISFYNNYFLKTFSRLTKVWLVWNRLLSSWTHILKNWKENSNLSKNGTAKMNYQFFHSVLNAENGQKQLYKSLKESQKKVWA